MNPETWRNAIRIVADFDVDGRGRRRHLHDCRVGPMKLARLVVWYRRLGPIHVENVSLWGALAVGRFDNLPGADVLTWGHTNGLAIDIVIGLRD